MVDHRLKAFFRIAPALLAIIVDYAGYGLVYPLVSVMFTQTGIEVFPGVETVAHKDFFMSLAYLLYPLGMFFGASFLGDLSDKFGRKKILELAMIGIFLSFILMAFGVLFHLLYVFLIGRLLSGLMAGSQPLSQAAIADVSTKADKSSNMSLIIFTNCIGIILGPFIAGIFTRQLFIEEYGFSIPFFISALLSLIAFFWLSLGFKETFQKTSHAPFRWNRPFIIFKEAFREKKLRILSLVPFLFQLGLAIYYQMIAVHLIKVFGYTSFRVGLYYGFMGISFAAGVLWLFPFLLKRSSLSKLIFSGILINGIMEVIIGLTPNLFLIWVWTIFIALSNVVGYTSLLTEFSNSTTKEKQGWIMGIFAAMVAAAFVIAGFSANLLVWLSPSSLIIIGGALIILGSLIFAFYMYDVKSVKKIN